MKKVDLKDINYKFFGHDPAREEFNKQLLLAILNGVSSNPNIIPRDAAGYTIAAYKIIRNALDEEEGK